MEGKKVNPVIKSYISTSYFMKAAKGIKLFQLDSFSIMYFTLISPHHFVDCIAVSICIYIYRYIDIFYRDLYTQPKPCCDFTKTATAQALF